MNTMNDTSSDLEVSLRAWARGMYTTEAAAELLIRAGHARPGAPWLVDAGDGRTGIEPTRLLASTGTMSGGERRLVDVALSLLSNDHPVDLGDAISGLDRHGVDLVLAALAHASGSHEHSGFAYDQDGKPTGIVRHTTLHPWPAR